MYLRGCIRESSEHTIFALSSGPPPSAIAVIRISGSHSRLAIKTVIGRLPGPPRATLAKVRDNADRHQGRAAPDV
jgi:tRNA modification GTPase